MSSIGIDSIAHVSRRRWCRIMQQRQIARFVIVGDSISWSMLLSLWKLLAIDAVIPAHKPPTRLLRVNCGSGSVEVLWVKSFDLNATIVADAVAGADLTLLNAGSWYSPANADMLRRARPASPTVPGRPFAGLSRRKDGRRLAGRSDPTPPSSTAWRLFAEDLLNVHDALRARGLPNDEHRLIWRTTPTGHPRCEQATGPLPSAGDALEALVNCRQCVDECALTSACCEHPMTLPYSHELLCEA
jgi:hypothetical protein